MIENEICIKFHYDQDQSTRAIRTFIKPPMADRGDRLVFDLQPDPTAPPEKNLDLFYALDKHLKAEDHCILHIRDAEADIVAFSFCIIWEYIGITKCTITMYLSKGPRPHLTNASTFIIESSQREFAKFICEASTGKN